MTTSHQKIGETPAEQERRQRFAFYLPLALAVGFAILTIVNRIYIYLGRDIAVRRDPIIILIPLVSALLSWRGRITAGIGLLILSIFGQAFFSLAQNSYIGLTTIPVTILIAIGILIQTWPPNRIIRGLYLIVIGGVGLVLTDLFWPFPRKSISGDVEPVFIAMAAVILIAILFITARRFSSYTLRTKLLIAFSVVTILPLGVAAQITVRATRNNLFQNANKVLFSAASQTAASLDDFFQNGLNSIATEADIVGQVACFNNLADPCSETAVSINRLLQTFQSKDPQIISYALLDPAGYVLYASPPVLDNRDESNLLHYQKAMNREGPYASPIQFASGSDEGHFYFSQQVRNREDELIGILRAQYNADKLQSLITRTTGSVGEDSFAVLFDENNLHLAHGTEPETIFKLVASPETTQIAALQAQGRLPDKPADELSTSLPLLDGKLRNYPTERFFAAEDVATGDRLNQVAVDSMRTQPWLVAFFQPQDVFLATVETQSRTTLLLSLGLAVLVLTGAVWLSQVLSRPIVELESVAAQVAAGDLSAEAAVKANDEIGALARTFNNMTTQLRDLVSNLESRVANRTRALETTTIVSRRLSTILEQEALVTAVVNEVKSAFNYYHVHIYLYNKEGNRLVMVGGTGEAGQQMLAQNHNIPRGKGLVGRAGQQNEVVLVPDVTQSESWLPNPLLPDTKSEIAVPITLGDEVLGVLDVQHNVTNGLQQSDEVLLQSIANQIAIALRNARLYEEVQQQAERNALIYNINQQILNTNDVQEAMQVAVRELGRALDAPYTQVRLKNKQAQDENGRSST